MSRRTTLRSPHALLLLQPDEAADGIAPKLNLAADCVLLVLASVLATVDERGLPRVDLAIVTALVAVSIWLVESRVLRQYDVWKGQGLSGDLALTSVLVLSVTSAVAIVWDIAPHHAATIRIGRFLLLTWPVALALRVLIPGLRRLHFEPADEVVIVGTAALARHTRIAIQEEDPLRPIAGHLALPGETSDQEQLDAPLLGMIEDLERVLHDRAVGEVYFAASVLRHAEVMEAAIHVCERYGVSFALPTSPFRFDRARLKYEKAAPSGYLHYVTYEHKPIETAIKRVFDVFASALALLLLAPLFIVVAGLIKLGSRGPVFFPQERVGLHGRHFYMLKFRSMVENADALRVELEAQNEQSGPVFKITQDPRVTSIGRFIRKFSIDELPQLINVLRGEMSIVGPRPPLPKEVEKYEPWQRRRLSVRPGITCVWQVSGRNEISFERWMYLDMQYIDHWSFKEDIKLILKTIPTVLSGRGAS